MTRPKLRDVAALAGVSEPTVSRVVNGRVGVAEATREKVLSALAELGWTDVVKDPASQRQGVVGIVAGEFSNPAFPTFVDALSTHLARGEFLASVAPTAPPMNNEERCLEQLLRSGVDGIVLLGGRHAETDGDLSLYKPLIDSGVPLVFVNGTRTDLNVPHVLCDEGVGARKATEHLISLGHERIACLLGSPDYVPTQRMLEGHGAAMAEAGLRVGDDSVVLATFTFEAGMAGARRLLDRGYTAVITSNDLMALGAIGAATAMGVSVPDQFSVVGYDGTALTALTGPPLTTLRQPFDDMARLIVESIVSEMSGSTRYRDHFVFEPELVSRGSSGRLSLPFGG